MRPGGDVGAAAAPVSPGREQRTDPDRRGDDRPARRRLPHRPGGLSDLVPVEHQPQPGSSVYLAGAGLARLHGIRHGTYNALAILH